MDIILVVLIGGLLGSFANVCIYRLPIDKNVVVGRSFCPKCKNKIFWFDNIPIISFIILKAKCRHCNFNIPNNYLIVECLSVLFFFLIYILFGKSMTALLFCVIFLSFIIIFFIDLKHLIIPNEITFPLMVIGFLKSFYPNLNNIFPNYLNSLIGGVVGYLIIYLIIFFYKHVRKKEGMGLGDAKLFAVIGFWFGWISIPFIIFFSSIIALISIAPSLINKTKNTSSQIPFGPYIIIATLVFIVFKNNLLNIVL